MALDDQHGWGTEPDETVRLAIEASTALLARADLEQLQKTTTHMTQRVWKAIEAAQEVEPNITIDNKRPTPAKGRELWMAGC